MHEFFAETPEEIAHLEEVSILLIFIYLLLNNFFKLRLLVFLFFFFSSKKVFVFIQLYMIKYNILHGSKVQISYEGLAKANDPRFEANRDETLLQSALATIQRFPI